MTSDYIVTTMWYMQIDIIPIGNSKGIRIPKGLLAQCGFVDSAEVTVENNTLVLHPNKNIRKGWSKAFAAMADDSTLLDVPHATEFDKSEWKW